MDILRILEELKNKGMDAVNAELLKSALTITHFTTGAKTLTIYLESVQQVGSIYPKAHIRWESETAELPVALRAAADARPGRHRSIYARLVITTQQGVIVHSAGSGEIRVDRPLPPDPGGATDKEQP